jgi:hypothetical protein
VKASEFQDNFDRKEPLIETLIVTNTKTGKTADVKLRSMNKCGFVQEPMRILSQRFHHVATGSFETKTLDRNRRTLPPGLCSDNEQPWLVDVTKEEKGKDETPKVVQWMPHTPDHLIIYGLVTSAYPIQDQREKMESPVKTQE